MPSDEHLAVADDRGERGSELVRDDAQEVRLQAIELAKPVEGLLKLAVLLLELAVALAHAREVHLRREKRLVPAEQNEVERSPHVLDDERDRLGLGARHARQELERAFARRCRDRLRASELGTLVVPAGKYGPRTALPSRRESYSIAKIRYSAPVKHGWVDSVVGGRIDLASGGHGLHARDSALRERAHVAADRLLGHRLREERAIRGEDAKRDPEERVE